jgi:NAD+ synthase (glutamine-hydrolysing)
MNYIFYFCSTETIRAAIPYNKENMVNYGFVKVAAAIPQVKVADCKWNVSRIELLIKEAEQQGVQMIVFPELSISGYTCGDLFAQRLITEESEMALMMLLNNTVSST